MHHTLFDLTPPRTIEAAFHNRYLKGESHPDRTMNCHDFVYITEGAWEILQDGTIYTVEKDDVMILTANAHHGGNTPCLDGTQTIYLHTQAQSCETLHSGPFPESTQLVPLPPVVCCKYFPEVRQRFEQIAETFSLDEPYRELRLQALFNELILCLYDAAYVRDNRKDSDFLKKVTHYLQSSPNLFYSNRELADLFFISEKAFIERFKKHTNTTPHRFQLVYKLKNIQTMLLSHPEMKLHELAANFGFYDEFHLSRCFKQEFGICPSEYRKNHIPHPPRR